MDAHLDEIHEKYHQFQKATKEGREEEAKLIWIEIEKMRKGISNGRR